VSADPEQQATARADALAGLVDVAAAAMAAGAAGQQATIKLVDFCFKCVASPAVRCYHVCVVCSVLFEHCVSSHASTACQLLGIFLLMLASFGSCSMSGRCHREADALICKMACQAL
jgi:hypothetical protein